jgi:hypothetical protein
MVTFLAVSVALLYKQRRAVPIALIVFIAGVVMAGVALARSDRHAGVSVGVPGSWMPGRFVAADWGQGTLWGALPQLPLTTLNSIVAVSALTLSMYPDRPVSNKALTRYDVRYARV